LVIAPSIDCHFQSSPFRSSYSKSAIIQMFAKKFFFTSAWKYRCSELPDPNAFGAAFHWQPVRRT
jgi:hypothetical protein